MSKINTTNPYERFLNPSSRKVPELDYDIVTGQCESTKLETKKSYPSCQNYRWVGYKNYGWDKGTCSKHIPN